MSNYFDRESIARQLSLLAFLIAFFLTTALANILYATPWGSDVLRISGYSDKLRDFPESFTVGFWTLLLMPFVVTPLVILAVRKAADRTVERIAFTVPELPKILFDIAAAACLLYVGYSFFVSGAVHAALSAKNDVDSVNARFFILSAVGWSARMVLQSLLSYLALYALIRAIRDGEPAWWARTLVVFVPVWVFHLLLNMKWPVLVFSISANIAVFLYSRRYAMIKTAVGIVVVVLMYFLVSTWIFKIGPDRIINLNQRDNIVVSNPFKASSIFGSAFANAPDLILNGLNRIAVAYPFYYDVFTREGAVCGGVIEQARIGPECRPSTLIYSRIFAGQGGFMGKGTSPMATHISAYALGGWPLAIFALLAASVILGLFSCLPVGASATVGAFLITGVVAGYHFSQVPGEGPIFYEHGFFWCFLMACVLLAIARILPRQAKPSSNFNR